MWKQNIFFCKQTTKVVQSSYTTGTVGCSHERFWCTLEGVHSVVGRARIHSLIVLPLIFVATFSIIWAFPVLV